MLDRVVLADVVSMRGRKRRLAKIETLIVGKSVLTPSS